MNPRKAFEQALEKQAQSPDPSGDIRAVGAVLKQVIDLLEKSGLEDEKVVDSVVDKVERSRRTFVELAKWFNWRSAFLKAIREFVQDYNKRPSPTQLKFYIRDLKEMRDELL
jgi:hypothetical protein